MSAVPVPPVTDNERDAQTIRENVAHIARGCRAHTSHNPAVYDSPAAAPTTTLNEPEGEA